MLLCSHRWLVAPSWRLDAAHTLLERLTAGELLGVILDRPVVIVASDLVAAAVLVVNRGYSLLVELLDAVLGALTVLQGCLVAESFDAIVVVDVRKALAAIVASSTPFFVRDLLVPPLQVGMEGCLAELLRVFLPGHVPAIADDPGFIERVEPDNVHLNPARAPAVVRPDRRTHD